MDDIFDAARAQRFFIALVPPLAIQAEANAVRQEFANRFDSHKAFNSPPHVTLHPPFRWPLSEVEQLQQVVGQFACGRSPLPVEFRGFGAFPPRVVYIDVVPSAALQQLKADLSQTLAQQLSIHEKAPHRAFRPHMTVAFRDLTRSAFQQAWPEFEQRSYQAAYTAHELTLLIHKQRWETYQTFSFGAG